VLLQVCQGLDNRFTLNRVAEVRQSRCSRKNASGYNSIHTRVSTPLAVAIPGNSLPEQVVIGGTANFLQLYNYVITARVLLSWFPQAQGMGFLRPLYTVTDPYLGIFRQLPLQVRCTSYTPHLMFLSAPYLALPYLPEASQNKLCYACF
ncbi:unnamed protein product, partial [Chrysoparadoxa australica]